MGGQSIGVEPSTPRRRGLYALDNGTASAASEISLLASYAHDLTVDVLPSAVVSRAVAIMFDTFGAAIYGSQDQFLQRLRTRMQVGGSGGTASVLGAASGTTPGLAAALNAAACTVTQLDEGHREVRGHPGVHVVLPALAVAETEGSDAAGVVAAVVAGYEVAVRVGFALGTLRPELHAHGHWPVVGGAVSVAKLLGADANTIAAAIEGAATLVLHPMERTTTDGVTVHHFFAGLGTNASVAAGYGAAAGMTASEGTLANYLGRWSSGHFESRELVRDLTYDSDSFEILRNYFKLQPFCAHAIAAGEAAASIRDAIGGTRPFERVHVTTYAQAAQLSDTRPASTLAARFSIPFVVATHLLGLDHRFREVLLTDTDLHDDALRRLMSKVDVAAEPSFSAKYPESRPVRVHVTAEDGSSWTAERELPTGDHENPAVHAEVERKFVDISSQVVGPVISGDMLDLWRELAQEPANVDLHKLFSLIRQSTERGL